MNRKAFYHLLKRYGEGDCTEEERKLVEQWYDLLGDDEDPAADLSATEIQETLQRLWPAIHQQTMAAAEKSERGGNYERGKL